MYELLSLTYALHAQQYGYSGVVAKAIYCVSPVSSEPGLLYCLQRPLHMA